MLYIFMQNFYHYLHLIVLYFQKTGRMHFAQTKCLGPPTTLYDFSQNRHKCVQCNTEDLVSDCGCCLSLTAGRWAVHAVPRVAPPAGRRMRGIVIARDGVAMWWDARLRHCDNVVLEHHPVCMATPISHFMNCQHVLKNEL